MKAASLFSKVRLPWRVGQHLSRLHLEVLRRIYDREISTTPAFVTGVDNPDFEIHALLGRKHVGMCLWSVKSLLHCAGRKYGVVLHDDGSLDDKDIEILRKHLINVKVIRRQVADRMVLEKLASYPNTRNYRLGSVGATVRSSKLSLFAMKLLDFNLLTDARKILVLDTDVLFFKKPDEIIEWIENPLSRECLYCFERYVPIRNARNKLVGYERKAEIPLHFNSGLICLDKTIYDLQIIEDWIEKKNGVVGKEHTFEQFAYNHLVYRNSEHRPLPDTYSFNYNDRDCVATHFGIKLLFFKNLNRIREALAGA